MTESDLLYEALYALERGKIGDAASLLDLCYSAEADRALDELQKCQDESAGIAAAIIRDALEELGS